MATCNSHLCFELYQAPDVLPCGLALQQPVRILSLDGGGVRGLSSLFILKSIMEQVELDEESDETPLPCRYFDLICGTSTGGLIAIMLGRLGMVCIYRNCVVQY